MYKIKTTKDGSSTIVSPYSGETYHSMGGAISESMYVYIGNGLLYTLKNVKGPINILEIGFGTGLNCYLTKLNQTNRTIYYTAIEPFPIPVEIAQSLNYKDIIVKDSNLFDIIHLNSNKLINYKNDFFFSS